MFRSILILCASFVGVAALTTIAGEKPFEVEKTAPEESAKLNPAAKRSVLITAELSRTQAQPGDKIRLIETVPVDPDTKISTVTHKLYVIGEYDYATKSLINYEPGKARFWGAGIVFDDCNISGSVGSVCDKAMPFESQIHAKKGLNLISKRGRSAFT